MTAMPASRLAAAAALVAGLFPAAFAESGVPAARGRIGQLLEQGLPAAAPGAAAPAAASLEAPVDQGPLFSDALWARLPAPDAATLQWLLGRVPDLRTDMVREIDSAALESVLEKAVERACIPTDLFTDPGLREPRVFLAREPILLRAFAAYEIPVVTLASGQTTSGEDYRLQALLMGAGRVEMLYDRHAFRIQNPYFSDHEYTLASRVSHGVEGPGDLTVSGITVEMFLRPRITRFVKLSADRIRVETNLGSRERHARRIARR